MMNRIEDEYNYDHRSHIFVTGTISVVVNKPHADSKIMNANYHANIKEMTKIREYEEQERLAYIEHQMSTEGKTNGSAKKPRVVVN